MAADHVWQMFYLDRWVQVGMWAEVDRGFGRTGVQSFALEGVLGELQVIVESVACEELCKQALHILICMHQQ